MAKNYKLTQELYLKSNDVPLVPQASSPNEKQEVPGPGAYQYDIQKQVIDLEGRMANRYKLNPFGSNQQRFKSPDENTKPLLTE